jgi:hypothetical protein
MAILNKQTFILSSGHWTDNHWTGLFFTSGSPLIEEHYTGIGLRGSIYVQ